MKIAEALIIAGGLAYGLSQVNVTQINFGGSQSSFNPFQGLIDWLTPW